MAHLLRKVLDVFQMLIQVPVDGGELDDRGSVLALEVFVDVSSEALLSLPVAVQFSQISNLFPFQFQYLAQANNLFKKLYRVPSDLAIDSHRLKQVQTNSLNDSTHTFGNSYLSSPFHAECCR